MCRTDLNKSVFGGRGKQPTIVCKADMKDLVPVIMQDLTFNGRSVVDQTLKLGSP